MKSIEAIGEQDIDHLIEELGDVLLQVLLHAQIGEDDGYFSIDDVIEGLAGKMVRRHPHVFGDKDGRNGRGCGSKLAGNQTRRKRETQRINIG